jgi:hypothetical protein
LFEAKLRGAGVIEAKSKYSSLVIWKLVYFKSTTSDCPSVMRHISLLDCKTSVFKHVALSYLLVRVHTGMRSFGFAPLESGGNQALSPRHG